LLLAVTNEVLNRRSCCQGCLLLAVLPPLKRPHMKLACRHMLPCRVNTAAVAAEHPSPPKVQTGYCFEGL
jgi:hypothetical protein